MAGVPFGPHGRRRRRARSREHDERSSVALSLWRLYTLCFAMNSAPPCSKIWWFRAASVAPLALRFSGPLVTQRPSYRQLGGGFLGRGPCLLLLPGPGGSDRATAQTSPKRLCSRGGTGGLLHHMHGSAIAHWDMFRWWASLPRPTGTSPRYLTLMAYLCRPLSRASLTARMHCATSLLQQRPARLPSTSRSASSAATGATWPSSVRYCPRISVTTSEMHSDRRTM